MIRMSEYWKANRAKIESEHADKIERAGQLTIYREDIPGQRPCVKIWRGNQGKHYAYTIFKDAAGREAFIAREKENDARYAETKLKWKAQRRGTAEMQMAQVQVGDVLYRTWGYDQTNVDFYQVIRKTASRLIVREIAHSTEETGFMSGEAMPIKNKFAENSSEMLVHPGKFSTWSGRSVHCSWYA